MKAPVVVLGAPEDRRTAGLAGEDEAEGAELVVVLGDAPAPTGPHPVIRWLRTAPASPVTEGEHLIAPAGPGLWSRAPWPAADALFALAGVPLGERIAVVGDRDGIRAALLAVAAERGLELDIADRLDVDVLRRAGCVILLDAESGTLPAQSPAVLAAGRVLIAPSADLTFGLQAQLDHLQFDAPERALNLCQSVLAHPTAFERVRLWGALAAERHRATRVYERLTQDIAMAGSSGGAR